MHPVLVPYQHRLQDGGVTVVAREDVKLGCIALQLRSGAVASAAWPSRCRTVLLPLLLSLTIARKHPEAHILVL